MRPLCACAIVTLLILGLNGSSSAQTSAVSDASVKLTTVLSALANAVPQDGAQSQPQSVTTPAPLSTDSLPTSVRDAIQSRRLRMNDRNEVQVYILVSSLTPEIRTQLQDRAVTIEAEDATRRRVQARIPVNRLQAVAALPFVDFIRLPTYARRHVGLVTTEGDHILHADAVRQQLSIDGTGVRVGVISDGLKGIFATQCTNCGSVAGGPISTGDLPDSVGQRNRFGVLVSSSGGIIGSSFQANQDLEGLPPASPQCGFPGAGAEGTALLEIVHDIAPGAQLSFANVDTDMSFAQAVDYLASTNDVVMDDLGFFGEPYDGTSIVSSATAASLNDPSYPIRGYYTAVGNDADSHYYGAYVDSQIDGSQVSGIIKPGHLHLFQQTAGTADVLGLGAQPHNVVSLPNNGEVVIFLTWDDPFGRSANNYDLYLVNQSTGSVVALSTDVQRGAQDPVEFIDYVNHGASGTFQIVVQNVGNAAAPKNLDLYAYEPECAQDGPRLLASPRHERLNYNTPAFSVSAQSDSGGTPVSAVSVGAICSASAQSANAFKTNPNESCLDTTHSTIEFFSSHGPTLDGRQKPDVSAIDGVSITGAGSFGSLFFGTSAATPHVAGIAALALQATPCLLDGNNGSADPSSARAALRHMIVDTAVPLTDSGAADNVFGSGRVDAARALQVTLPVFTGQSDIVVNATSTVGTTLTAANLGFSDPSHCPLTTMAWSGGCGTSPGASMTCPQGTTTVSVSVSNNGLTFSAPVDLRITVR